MKGGRWTAQGGACAAALAALLAAPPAAVALDVPVRLALVALGQIQVQGAFPPIQIAPTEQAEPEAPVSVFPQPEREVLQRLANARELLDQKRYAEAVQLLGGILESPEDSFFQPDPAKPLHRSLKAEAQRLVGQMPREGRQVYELQYGARARQMLDRATAEGDSQRLAEVSRRFFHTEAGREATFLLGLDHLNHDEPLAAALSLSRLQGEGSFEPTLSLALATCWARAGMTRKAQDTLDALAENRRGRSAWIAGQQVPLFAEGKSRLDWLLARTGTPPRSENTGLAEWTMARGNPSRTASVTAGAPLLSLLWSVPASGHPMIESILENQGRYYAQRDLPVLPRTFPLAVGDVVLTRSLQTLVAVDFRTGKRVWEAPVDDPMDQSLDAFRSVFRTPAQLAGILAQRAWIDSIYGSLSSDGQRVFSVEDLGYMLAPYGQALVVRGGRQVANPLWPRPYNRLAAYDIRTGKLVWELGGSAEEDGLPQADWFFLGAPLPLSGWLYALAESRGEVRLLALEGTSGRVLWSQQVAMLERGVAENVLRRTAVATPSYADGVLVCPTANGAIVAVELATRSLLWGFQYATLQRTGSPMLPFRVMPSDAPGQTRWSDDTLILAEGRVLVASSDSPTLACLSLLDGKLLWQVPRQEDLFVGCVESGNVLLVGARQIRAVRLEDGQPGWGGRTIGLPDETVPSGQGFASAGQYYLPVGSAGILALDLEKGEIARTIRSPQDRGAGNLICHQGKILSQGLAALDVFCQADVLRAEVDAKLAASPDDPKALAWRGELLLDAGDRAGAIACLRRSLSQSADARTCGRLRDALLEGLRDEFATYGAAAGEIEPLLDAPAEKADFCRLMIAGLEGQKQWNAALDYYRRLLVLGRQYDGLVREDDAHSVRLDRWLEVRLAALAEAAPDEVRSELDRAARDALAEATKSDNLAGLRFVVDCFASHPAGAEARRTLFARCRKEKRLLEAELLLWRDVESDDPATAAAATIELAALLREAGRPGDAAECFRRLARRFGEVVCAEGKTGRQLAESLGADDPVRPWLAPDRLWPVGKVDLKTSTADPPPQNQYNLYPVAYRGTGRPFFEQGEVTIDQIQQRMTYRDGLGKEQWTVDFASGAERQRVFNPATTSLLTQGHLMLLWLGQRYVAIDALGDSARLLWNRSLQEPVFQEGSPILLGGMGGGMNVVWGQQVFLSGTGYRGTMAEGPCILSHRNLCYQQFRGCVAIDPITGQTLWTHRRLPRESTIFGDDEYLFVVPAGGTEALVLRAADGALLPARRTVPPPDQHLATFGRRVLVWRPEGDRRVLEMVDPWQQRVLWGPYAYSASAKCDLAGGEVVGVLEPGGHFAMVRLSDGQVLTDADLPEESAVLQGLVLFSSGDQYTLITQRSPRQSIAGRMARPVRGAQGTAVAEGRVYALGRDGKLLWPKPVAITNQQVLINQPGWLPVVVFAAQTYDPKLRPSRWSTSVLVLDKRNGRRLLKKDYPNQVSYFDLSGDAEAKTIRLALQHDVVTMTFTDAPLEPEVEEPEEPEPPPLEERLPKTLGHLLKAARDVIEEPEP